MPQSMGANASKTRRLTSFIAIAVAASFAVTGLQAPGTDPAATAADVLAYQNTTLPFEVRAADLVSRMTLEEKVMQFRSSNTSFGD